MANKIYPITKFRFVALTASIILLLVGIISYVVLGGFNLGIDFQSGFSQRVQIANPTLSLSYSGNDSVTVNVSNGNISLIVRDGDGSRSLEFLSSAYKTVGEMASALHGAFEGLEATALQSDAPTSSLITGFGLASLLDSDGFVINGSNQDRNNYVSIDDMRSALGNSASVQIVGEEYQQIFQIRLANEDGLLEDELSKQVGGSLASTFGEHAVVVLQSDFVGPKYSSTLVSGSILIVVVSISLILLYIWFRFKLAFALAAVITLVHDTFLLIGFITILRLEVSSTTIAALLTIIGYSLNNVIVIFDRIRENKPLLPKASTMSLIDTSVSQSLSRTLFSSLTTILAILPLAIFASGAIQLFAIEMVFGIVVGAYSSNLLAPALFMWISKEKNKKEEGKPVTTIEAKKEVETDKVEPVEVEIPRVERKPKGKRQQKK